MSKKDLVLFNANDVRIERNEEGTLVVSSRIIAEQLGKRHDNVVRDLEQILENGDLMSLIISSTYEVSGQSRKYKEYLLTPEGLGIYLNKIQTINKKLPEFLLEFADMKQFHSHTRFELSFLDMLEEALTEIGIFGNRQYCVDQYKLDFYIEELKLTIEYDEEHHSSKIDEDTKRQEYIMKKLGCIFIRCNYKDSDIKNVMKVIKYILKGSDLSE